ncbi:MAG: bifunctional diaminohydroxyphosphoribosylaminopyrimidine deaminase/5-amino-6-(5-phosphoribosylamino)uracil reductase RibD [Candidatus Sericytochromatia bacterium]
MNSMSPESKEQHEKWMRRTLTLARKGFTRISPDPFRGAVLVQGDEIVGEGYLANRDDKDPELYALEAAGERARGATLYVNLEPAYGAHNNIDVVDALIAGGIGRIVAAMGDPNPQVSGKSLFALKTAGVEVVTGIGSDEARQLNEIYIKDVSTRRPFVNMLTAMSLDGKIATAMGDSQDITSAAARDFVHTLRARYDAILIGVNAILQDDPQLNCKSLRGCDPWRVIVDSQARTPVSAKIFLRSDPTDTRPPVLIAISYGAHEEHLRSLRHAGAEIIQCPDESSSEPRVDLARLMDHLHRHGITSVLLEGGGTLKAAALQAGIVDKVTFIVAPKLIGGADAKTPVEGEGATIVSEAFGLKRMSARPLGEDLLIEGYLE